MQFTANDIASITGASLDVLPSFGTAAGRVSVRGVCIDSRQAREGDLFVCLPGTRTDGHDFALAACRNGACAVLAARPLPELSKACPSVPVLLTPAPQEALRRVARAWRGRYTGLVVGLTGTAGKTTLKEWLSAVLSQFGRTARTEGNLNNQLGLPLCLCRTDGNERFWVFEAGISRAGDMEELGDVLRPNIGVVLNASVGHTEGLGERGVAWHKTRLFTLLAKGGLAVASCDYPELEACAVEACRTRGTDLRFFSVARDVRDYKARCREGKAACVALVERDKPTRCRLRLKLHGEAAETSLVMPQAGVAAAENCACLALVAGLAGIGLDALQGGLNLASVPDHRFARHVCGKNIVIDDSYNANPLSMARMLEAAKAESDLAGTRFAVVLGAMLELGSKAPDAHMKLGKKLAGLAPAFVLWKGGYAEDVRAGLGKAIPFKVFSSNDEFTDSFASYAQDFVTSQGLTVLCKGSHSNRLEEAANFIQNWFAAKE